MFQMMGVFAGFERAMIRERVKAGLERARARGKTLGRERKLVKKRHKANKFGGGTRGLTAPAERKKARIKRNKAGLRSKVGSASVSAHNWSYAISGSLCDICNGVIGCVLKNRQGHALCRKECNRNLLSDCKVDSLRDKASVF
jgi:hypothetical protein